MQLNDTAQIIVAITIAVAVIAAIILVYRRGIRVGWKKGAIDINGKSNSGIIIHLTDLEIIMDIMIDSVMLTASLCQGTKLERKMSYAQEKITHLRGLKEQQYFQLLKKKGIPQDRLTSHPDAQYYLQVLGNALYYDNGTQSLVSQLRRNLRSEDNRIDKNRSEKENKDRFNEFISSFTDSALQRWKRFFIDNYRTDVMDIDGNMRKREITCEDLYDMDFDPQHIAALRRIFEEIFEYARGVDADIEKEKQEVETKRKEKIHQIVAMRQQGRK